MSMKNPALKLNTTSMAAEVSVSSPNISVGIPEWLAVSRKLALNIFDAESMHLIMTGAASAKSENLGLDGFPHASRAAVTASRHSSSEIDVPLKK